MSGLGSSHGLSSCPSSESVPSTSSSQALHCWDPTYRGKTRLSCAAVLGLTGRGGAAAGLRLCPASVPSPAQRLGLPAHTAEANGPWAAAPTAPPRPRLSPAGALSSPPCSFAWTPPQASRPLHMCGCGFHFWNTPSLTLLFQLTLPTPSSLVYPN